MKKIDDSGYWIIKANPISRVGVFDYLGRQIDIDRSLGLDPNRIYKAFRPAEELFSPAAIESFEGIPFIDEHEMLGEGYTPVEKRPSHGTITNVRPSVDQPGALIADIKIYTRTMKEKIESGKKGLSLGYYCKYEPEVGCYNGQTYDFVQKNIRGNHIALVNKPRNDVYVCDCAVADVVTFDSLPEEILNMKNKDPDKSKALQEKLTSLLTANDAEACAACLDFLDDFLAKREAAKAAKPNGQPAADGGGAQPGGTPPGGTPPVPPKKEDGAQPNGGEGGGEPSAKPNGGEGAAATSQPPAGGEGGGNPEGKPAGDCGGKPAGEAKPPAKPALDEAVARKEFFKEFAKAQELAGKISALTGTFDSSEMTERDVAVYGCKKLGIVFDEANPDSAVFAVKAALKYAKTEPAKTVTLDSAETAKKVESEASQTSKCLEEYFRT
jgi:hypothetical protein